MEDESEGLIAHVEASIAKTGEAGNIEAASVLNRLKGALDHLLTGARGVEEHLSEEAGALLAKLRALL